MSFLLRNRGNSGNAKSFPRLPPPNDCTTVYPRSHSTRGANQHHGGVTVQTGNQVMLQRNASQLQRSKVSHQGQSNAAKQQSQAREHDSQGVISMSEVLADLHVLEMQQRDAQQKLVAARATKEQRLELHATLESKLETLKYSNGELRAQLRQSRDLLSTGTRSLGTRRLVTDKAGGDVRGFEKTLKLGLVAARINAGCLRKIDSIFIQVENKLAAVERLKIEAKAKLASSEAAMKAEIRSEESLRTAIQQEVASAQQDMNEMANIRARIAEAEKDLLAAQNMEESTRTRCKAVADQTASEKKHHITQAAELSSKVATGKANVASFAKKSEAFSKELELKALELDRIKANLVVPAISLDEQGNFNVANIESEINAIQAHILGFGDSNDALQREIQHMQESILKNDETSSQNRGQAKLLTVSAEAALTFETNRSKELNEFSAELHLERETVVKLEASHRDLLAAREKVSADHNQKILECQTAIEDARLAIDATNAAIKQNTVEYEDDRSAWNTEKACIQAKLEAAQERSNAADASLNRLDDVSKEEDEAENYLQQELNVIQQRQAKARREIEEHVFSLTKDFPKLQSIASKFVYDGNLSRSDQTAQILAPLKAELESLIRAAKNERERKRRERSESRRKIEAAAEEVRRQDIQRRKNQRARMEAEIKRQKIVGEEPTSELASGIGSAAVKLDKQTFPQPSRKDTFSGGRKGADFYFPQFQRESPDEETPAQPKSLLASFSSATQKTLTPTSDKRVHWKDDTDDEDSDEKEAMTKASRKPKQYGKARRGLAAIAGKKDKKSPKQSTFDSLAHLGMDSDDGSCGEIEARAPKEKRINNNAVPSDRNPASSVNLSRNSFSKISPKVKKTESPVQPAACDGDLFKPKLPSKKANYPTAEAKHPSKVSRTSRTPNRKTTSPNRQGIFKDSKRHAHIARKSEKQPRAVKSMSRSEGLSSFAEQAKAPESDHKKRSPESHDETKARSRDPLNKKRLGQSRSVAVDASRLSKRLKREDDVKSISSGKSTSKSVTSQSSKAYARSKKSNDSRKYRPANTQASGLSSCEGAPKHRRRKKSSPSQQSSMNLADEAYSFAF